MLRPVRVLAPVVATAAGLALTAVPTGVASAAGGVVGPTITAMSGQTLSGYDAATTSDGVSVIAWIGNAGPGRRLYACVLKAGDKACEHGVQSTPAITTYADQDVKAVAVGKTVKLVWIVQKDPDTGPYSAAFGTATVSGGHLSAAGMIGGAPAYGTLTSAIATKSGDVAVAVLGNSTLDNTVYYYPKLTAKPTAMTRPYFVGNASLADNGHQTVITASQYGSLSGRVSVAWKSSTSTKWSKFSNVAHSYTLGGIEQIQNAGGKIALISASDKELYTPYVWKWNGKSFGNPTTTGDHKDISSIDTTSDASGRLASVETQVGGLAVGNFAGGTKSARFTLKVADTYAGGRAQITTSPSGKGWVAYSVQRDGVSGQIMRIRAIKVSAATRSTKAKAKGGSITLTGPANCMPVSTLTLGLSHTSAKGWKYSSKSLLLSGKKHGWTLDGSSLKANTSYTLTAKGTFKKGSARSTATTKLTFKTCGRP